MFKLLSTYLDSTLLLIELICSLRSRRFVHVFSSILRATIKINIIISIFILLNMDVIELIGYNDFDGFSSKLLLLDSRRKLDFS